MYSLLSGLQSHLKRQEIIIDNVIFRIHCTFTTVLLFTFSMIIAWTQFVGQPIRCQPGSGGIPSHITNSYCWAASTFTVPDVLGRASPGQAYPGVGQSTHPSQHKHQSYYQWVSFVLLIQSLFFYFPKWLWNSWEQGFMKTLVYGLQVGLRSEEQSRERKGILVAYLTKHANQFTWYAYKYWFCEFLCLVNVITQLFLINWFFNGDFLLYGFNVVNFDGQNHDQREDYMISVFPRMTKCTFLKFGGGGSPEIHDSLCLLPLNIVNEKTYIFLWFYLIALAAMTTFLVMSRVLVIFVVGLRQSIMQARYRMVNEDDIEKIAEGTSVSNWWIIYLLGRNMDPYLYGQVIREISKKFRSKEEKSSTE